MAIFEIGDKEICEVARTTFGQAGAKERDILQRLLRDQIPLARLNGIGEDDLERNLGQLRNTCE